jgi:hypothetical protein
MNIPQKNIRKNTDCFVGKSSITLRHCKNKEGGKNT